MHIHIAYEFCDPLSNSDGVVSDRFTYSVRGKCVLRYTVVIDTKVQVYLGGGGGGGLELRLIVTVTLRKRKICLLIMYI